MPPSDTILLLPASSSNLSSTWQDVCTEKYQLPTQDTATNEDVYISQAELEHVFKLKQSYDEVTEQLSLAHADVQAAEREQSRG